MLILHEKNVAGLVFIVIMFYRNTCFFFFFFFFFLFFDFFFCFLFFFCFVFSNSVDPDQTLRSAMTDLSLHFLQITLLGVTRRNWDKKKIT